MRKAIQRWLCKYGVLVRRPGPFECAIAELYMRKKGFSFVQIGAFDGVSHDSLYWMVQAYNGRGIVVEPLPDVFERLKANYAWLSKVKPVCVAVHPTLSTLRLYRVAANNGDVPAWAHGSSSFNKQWLTQQGIEESAIEDVSVPALHLQELLVREQLLDLDVLQIDTEGFDAQVISMIDFATCRPAVIKFESRRDIGTDAVAEQETILRLEEAGYYVSRMVPDIVAVHYRKLRAESD